MEPDRRSAPTSEGSRHYLDAEKLDPAYQQALKDRLSRQFGDAGYADEDARDLVAGLDRDFFSKDQPPWKPERVSPLWASLPPNITEYRKAFGREEIFTGSVVYQPFLLFRALVRARGKGDLKWTLPGTGYLAHFTGDLTMPFHLTANYKGQFTGNLVFSDKERGDIHARFETGFVKARRETIAAALKKAAINPVIIAPASITPRALRLAADSYAFTGAILKADASATGGADPRGDWERYLDAVSAEFLPLMVRQMAASSQFLADLILSAYSTP